MAKKHSGGPVGKAAATLAKKDSTKKEKSQAARKLKEHQDKEH